ncbi:MAG: hypothetical protein GX306_07285 [Clostridiales bacterium]|nr:hypothetical protein [Clostridiales bacterium]
MKQKHTKDQIALEIIGLLMILGMILLLLLYRMQKRKANLPLAILNKRIYNDVKYSNNQR